MCIHSKAPFFSGETLESSSLFPDPIHNDKPFDIAQKRTQSSIATYTFKMTLFQIAYSSLDQNIFLYKKLDDVYSKKFLGIQ